ncbi:MAG: efflux RND transporter permease subunit [Planctomycetota bacterium]
MTETVHGSAAVRRPVTVLMAVLTLIVIGVIAYSRIPLQLTPPGISNPQLTIWIPLTTLSPNEVMEEIARPIEEQLRTVPGLTEVTSYSSSDFCQVRVEHGDDQDADAIYADIQDRMERILPSLPEGTERYRIFKFDLDRDLPIIFMAVSFDDAVSDPDGLLDNVIQPRIEGVDGVARVSTMGQIASEVEIELDPERVNALGVNMERLVQRLRQDNAVEPLGVVEEDSTRHIVRLSGRFDDFDEIRNFPVRQSLLLGDIAVVQERRGLRDFLARVDGRISRLVQISKESDANTVDTCLRVQAELDRMEIDPRTRGVSFLAYFNQGEQIEAAVAGVRQTSLWGGLFAVIVLFFFLRQLPLTFLVALSIPLSILGAVTAIFFRGGTFNVISLSGLTLSIGMLVDNAIVVAENIFRHRELGASPLVAAGRGVREVALPVTLATLTTVAVFVPLMFLTGDGNVRVIAVEVGLPICYAVLASLLVSLIAVPAATRFLRPRAATQPRVFAWLSDGYRALLSWSLRHRLLTIGCAFFLLMGTVTLQPMLMESTGRAEGGASQVQIDINCPPFFSLEDTDAVMEEIRRACDPIREELQIETIACWYDRGGGTFACFNKPGARKTREQFLERLREVVPQTAGVEYSFVRELSDERSVYIEARGRDPKRVNDLLGELREQLRPVPGVVQAKTRRERAREEIVVEVERERAQRYGVNPSQVSNLVSWALRGAPLADFHAPDGEKPTWIRYAGSDLENIGDLYRVPIYSPDGREIPVATIADFSVERGLPGIRRRNGQVYERLTVVLSPEVDNRLFTTFVDAAIADLDVGEGYTVELGGRNLRGGEAFGELIGAAIVGALLIFVIMGVLFESVVLPISVFASVPALFIGSSWFLFLFDVPPNEVVPIGSLLLLGIVVNNAIVFVDCINRYRLVQPDRFTAILRAGEDRLRPILMTACTTIFGLIPLSFMDQQGEGVDYRPLGVIVMGGLIVATVFTLTVVPVAYTIVDSVRRSMSHGWQLSRSNLPGGRRGS